MFCRFQLLQIRNMWQTVIYDRVWAWTKKCRHLFCIVHRAEIIQKFLPKRIEKSNNNERQTFKRERKKKLLREQIYSSQIMKMFLEIRNKLLRVLGQDQGFLYWQSQESQVQNSKRERERERERERRIIIYETERSLTRTYLLHI